MRSIIGDRPPNRGTGTGTERSPDSAAPQLPQSGSGRPSRGPRKSPEPEEIRLPFEPPSQALHPGVGRRPESPPHGVRGSSTIPGAPEAPEQVLEAIPPVKALLREPPQVKPPDIPDTTADKGAAVSYPDIETLEWESRETLMRVQLGSPRAPEVLHIPTADPQSPLQPESTEEGRPPIKTVLKEGDVMDPTELMVNPPGEGKDSPQPSIEPLAAQRGQDHQEIAPVTPRPPQLLAPLPERLPQPTSAADVPAVAGTPPVIVDRPEPTSLETHSTIRAVPLQRGSDAQDISSAVPRAPKLLPPLLERFPESTPPTEAPVEAGTPDLMVNQSGRAAAETPPTIGSVPWGRARDGQEIASATPRAPQLLPPLLERFAQSAFPVESPVQPMSRDQPVNHAPTEGAVSQPIISAVPLERGRESGVIPPAGSRSPQTMPLSTETPQSPVPGLPQQETAPPTTPAPPPPTESRPAETRDTASTPRNDITEAAPEGTPSAPPVPGKGTETTEAHQEIDGPGANTPEPGTREPGLTPPSGNDLPRESPPEPDKSAASPAHDSPSATGNSGEIPPQHASLIPGDILPSPDHSIREPPPEIIPSPLDAAVPNTAAVREYLAAAAPVLEELSLLMTRIPGLALEDFDASKGGLSTAPQDIVVKMESIKRELQILDSRTFSIIPPRDYVRFHGLIRESIAETYRACESAVNFFTEKNIEDLKKVHEHVRKAEGLVERGVGKAN